MRHWQLYFFAHSAAGRGYPKSFGFASTSIQYLFDHQGNVAQRLDASNNVLSYSCYEAYGTEHSSSTPTDPFGYNAQSGYYLDRETGLYLCTYRYYDPANGRWINRDPIGYAGGMNLYGYCSGGPILGMDISGMAPWYQEAALGVWDGIWGSGMIAQGISSYHLLEGAFAANSDDNGLTQNEKIAGYLFNSTLGAGWDSATFQNGIRSGVGFWTPVAVSVGAGLAGARCSVPEAGAAEARAGLSQVRINNAAGLRAQHEFAELLRADGLEIRENVTYRTPFGKRVVDIEVSREGAVLGGIEVKTAGGRYYGTVQYLKDTWLLRVEKYRVNFVRWP